MGRGYDGKKRWNETVLRTGAAAPPRVKKAKRLSGASSTGVCSLAVYEVDMCAHAWMLRRLQVARPS